MEDENIINDDLRMYEPDRLVYGPWRPVGHTIDHNVDVPTEVNGFGRPITSVRIPITRTVERRHVWVYIGEEERIVES